MTDNPTTLVWHYDGDGGLSCQGPMSVAQETPALLQALLLTWDPEEDDLERALDEEWETPFQATVTSTPNGDTVKLGFALNDDHPGTLTGAVTVMLYILTSAQRGEGTHTLEVLD